MIGASIYINILCALVYIGFIIVVASYIEMALEEWVVIRSFAKRTALVSLFVVLGVSLPILIGVIP